jgi:hypothetical protein
MRVPANRYNMWLHTHLWSDRIESMMASGEYDPNALQQPAASPEQLQ